MTTDTGLIALVTVASELGQPVDVLAGRLGGQITQDATTGLRMVPAAAARALIDEQAAARVRERERARSLSALVAKYSLRQRVRALAAQQEQLRASGQWDPDMSAYAVMAAGDTRDHLDGYASRRMDRWLRGESDGAGISPRKD
jgi:hypothetical protein